MWEENPFSSRTYRLHLWVLAGLRAGERLMSDIDQLQEAMNELEPYVDHLQSCLVRSGRGQERDICNCGVDDVVAEVDEAIRSLHAEQDDYRRNP